MSTDIVDKDLKELRNSRWDKAFKKGTSANHVDENPRDEVNRKATIVIEHIIQASDISHTMQHWHVYRKWNQNLFEELYVAYLNGRMDKDPSEFWFTGEIVSTMLPERFRSLVRIFVSNRNLFFCSGFL